jgi:hypothetical protein
MSRRSEAPPRWGYNGISRARWPTHRGPCPGASLRRRGTQRRPPLISNSIVVGPTLTTSRWARVLFQSGAGALLHGRGLLPSLRRIDVIEPIRIEALVALFSGSFARTSRGRESVEQPANRRYLPRARVLLHGQSRACADDAERAGGTPVGVDSGACERRTGWDPGGSRQPCGCPAIPERRARG